MNHKMRFAIATFAALLLLVLSTAIIGSGSGHIALAYNNKFIGDFSNSGNNQETQQDCGNSCTQTSSNTINPSSGSSGLTTTSPSPSSSPTPTTLTLSISEYQNTQNKEFGGTLTTDNGSAIVGATITFICYYFDENLHMIPDLTAVTNQFGDYHVIGSVMALAPYTSARAHYAGSSAFAASDSPLRAIP